MKKLFSILCVVALLAGCGETEVSEQETSQESKSSNKFDLTIEHKDREKAETANQDPSPEAPKGVRLKQRQKENMDESIKNNDLVIVHEDSFKTAAISDIHAEPIVVLERVNDHGLSGVGDVAGETSFEGVDHGGVASFSLGEGHAAGGSGDALNSIGVVVPQRNLVVLNGGPTEREGTPRPFVPGEEQSTEEYDRIYENPFMESKGNPLSTFSIDVDTASYANSRRFLREGQLPPKDAVRIEEFINYFKYDYPAPTGEDPFSINCELSTCPWNDKHELLLVGLQGKKIELAQLPPSNLVFLADVSGSMNSHKKLPLLKASLRMLVDNLRPEDKVALVVYSGAAGLALDSTSGKDKKKILQAIENLRAGGSTAGGKGIRLAYEIAKKNFMPKGNNRIILATDGDFNVGVSSDAELTRLIESKRDEGVFLTVLGFGTGNYKDSKMEKLADKGNGNYAYIDGLREAKKALVDELGGTLFTIAKDVKLQLEFNPATVSSYRLIGYENRMLKKEDFNDDKKDAGELGAGHRVTALYEIVRVGAEEPVAKVDKLKYQKKVKLTKSKDLLTLKLRYKAPKETESQLIERVVQAKEITLDKPSENWAFASAVAEFALVIRDSEHKGTSSFESALERARKARGKDEHGYRAEFIRLIEEADLLAQR